jgi:cytochrome c-type biogenesis protein CcmH
MRCSPQGAMRARGSRARAAVIIAVISAIAVISPVLTNAQSQPPTVAEGAFVLGLPEGTPLSGEALNQHTEMISGDIRCPVCQGLAIRDSFSDTAVAMKAEVKQMLAEGYSDEQVFAYFEASYGEFIRLKPSTKGFNIVVWIAPVVVLLIGFLLVVMRLRGARHDPRRDSEDESSAPPTDEDDDLAAYLDRVRKELEPES